MPQDDDSIRKNDPDAEKSNPQSSQPDDDDVVVNLAFGELSLEDEFRRRLLLDAAAAYAQRGWRVHPLCWVNSKGQCGYSGHTRKHPCPSPGKRAILDEWQHRATNDPVKAGSWWRKVKPNTLDNEEWYPLASIGIVLGEGSGIFALDVDPQHGGFAKLEELEQRHGALPGTRVHKTGGDGAHYLFDWPGFRVYNLKPWGKDVGLDIKGDNGYIVVPPSISHKGRYEVSAAMADAPILAAPEWILEKLRQEKAEQRGEQVITADALPNRLIAKYVEQAMKRERYGLAKCPAGARNDQLNSAAFSLGTLGAHGFLSEGEALALLTEAGYENKMIQDDGIGQFMASFHSGWNSGLRNPRDLSGIGNLAEQGWPRLPRNEFALGDRLVIYFGDRLRWVDDWQAWMSYSSGIWERRTMTEAERYAERVIRLLATTEAPLYDEEPEPLADASPREIFTTWLEKQKTHSKKVNVAKIARDSPIIRALPHQFDNEPSLLNVANGVIDLTTGELRDHDPDLMLTVRSPVAFSADQGCPKWLAFLKRVQPNQAMRDYLQRVVGYSATGEMIEQVFFLHHGSGANGKSVFHDVISRVLGAYSQTVPVETLMDSTMDRVPNDIARMVGRRYLIASETKMGKFLDEPKLKLLTGGDTVSARFMRGEFFEFRPTGKVHLTTNHLPRLSDDAATWRRIHMIVWPEHIPEAERDGNLAETLVREEGAGILNWIIQGALDWRYGNADKAALEDTPWLRGLRPPDVAQAVKEDYKRTEDELQLWLDEEVSIDLEREIITSSSASSVLWAHFNAWLHNNGYRPVDQRAFTERVKKKGYRYGKSGSHRGFAQLTPRAGV
jgi:putative DNA primase/helicase